MKTYLDIWHESLSKEGEELCGDVVRVTSTPEMDILVLSDGLGSGVKANILATLTSQIVATMLKSNVGIKDVIETIVATLPVCAVRNLAYATFTAVQVDHRSRTFHVINFDNPPVMHFRNGKLKPLQERTERVLDKQIVISEGMLKAGDFLAVLSDGVLNAGPGFGVDSSWGWQEISKSFEGLLACHPSVAQEIVRAGIAETKSRYDGWIQDDATFLGAFLRRRKSLIVFTGPPVDESMDEVYAGRVLGFEGRRVVCGDTTAQIMQNCAGELVKPHFLSESDALPPAGFLSKVDLVTEGILTMAAALEILKSSDADSLRLTYYPNAAERLAKELIDADFIQFLVGQTVNPYYMNPQLPRSVSIRRSLVEQIAQVLRGRNKEVSIEFC